MYTFISIKAVVNELATSYRCPVVPTKLQVREFVSCLNIRDLRCGLGATVYTVVLLYTGNSCFLRDNLHEPVKVFHEGGWTCSS